MEAKKKSHSPATLVCNESNLIPNGATIIVALSGGPDSVFLLHYLLELKQRGKISFLIAAHLDHEWRDSSEQDVLFCKQLTAKYNLPFETKKLSELQLNLKWNGSKEEIARKARRHFLESVMKKHSANAIALGHHAQDQQETFFIRLLRGASLTGLTAMKQKSGHYIRPLLSTNKADIIHYLDSESVPYLKDDSNDSAAFLRNRIRKHVLPALKKVDERFDQSFDKSLLKLQETENYLNEQAQHFLSSISLKEKGPLQVDTTLFLQLPQAMKERVLIKWLCHEMIPFSPSNAFIKEMLRFLDSPRGGSHTVYAGWALKKRQKIAYIEKVTG